MSICAEPEGKIAATDSQLFSVNSGKCMSDETFEVIKEDLDCAHTNVFNEQVNCVQH